MKITDEFLAELEAAAKAAKDGDWAVEISHRVFFSGPVQPAHVLAIIAEMRAARKELEDCRWSLRIAHKEIYT